jgi:hypothetical protein
MSRTRKQTARSLTPSGGSVLCSVNNDEIDIVWPGVVRLIASVINHPRNDKDEGLVDVYDALKDGTYQLWISEKDDQVEAICITGIEQRPRKKICKIPYIAGVDHKNWIPFLDALMRFARSQGCDEMEGYFRKGWLRVLRDSDWEFNWTHGRLTL